MIQVTDSEGRLITIRVKGEHGGSDDAAEKSVLEMLHKSDQTLVRTPAVVVENWSGR